MCYTEKSFLLITKNCMVFVSSTQLQVTMETLVKGVPIKLDRRDDQICTLL